MAQQPYTIFLSGTVFNCYPGQMLTVQTTENTLPALSFDVAVDPDSCTWSAQLGVSSTYATWQVSTPCNGQIASASSFSTFGTNTESIHYVELFCGNGPEDCAGIPGGPNLPGTACFDFFGNAGIWSNDCICEPNAAPVDCNGLENGPDMPGTSCDDGNSQTVYDTWTPGCVCFGVAPGECWTIAQLDQVIDDGIPVPSEVMLVATSAGAQPITYSWYFGWPWVFVGTTTTPSWQQTVAPGQSLACRVVAVDANGCESEWGNVEGLMSCDGILGSPNYIGQACTVPGTTQPGIWSTDCICQANIGSDCEGTPNGNALPGTPCMYTPDNGVTWLTGIWSPDCVCEADTTQAVDCEGNPGGDAQPGTPCTVPGTILEGTWSSACTCEPNTTDPCEANFWVLQAFGPDSLPVPYELWVWNLSSGGTGNFQFLWNFGDGSTSTDPFPTHTYSGNGPYNLCLTIYDNNGCQDTHCDSISINEDGIYEGMVVHAEDRQDGFTVNVQNPAANAVVDVGSETGIATWPNPATDELNVALAGDLKGLVTITITDLDGRVVKSEQRSLGGDRNQLRIATGDLNAGMYLLRIGNGAVNLSQRFVKTN